MPRRCPPFLTPIAVLAVLILSGGAADAQQNTCRYAFDGECDEPKICSTGTDAWDCRGEGVPGPNDCFWAYDGECDEPSLCPGNSDSWDCRQQGAAPGPESCAYSNDGECDEPGTGTGVCLAGTDTMDCHGGGGGTSFASNNCEWSYDGECDEPEGTDLCTSGSDSADCRGNYGGVFYGEDDRGFVDTSSYPWSTIGKVMFESGGHCTATVVGRHTLLTAAHCMFLDNDSNQIDRPTLFYAGLDGDFTAATARVIGHVLASGFDNMTHSSGSDIDGQDWAFLTVDRDLAAEVGMMDVMPLRDADLEAALNGNWYAVNQAGYSSDSDTRLTANRGCPIVEVFDDNTVFHECDTLQGDSGSPLFVERDGRYWIIGVESATYPNSEGPYPLYNMAVDARAFYREYLRQARPKQ